MSGDRETWSKAVALALLEIATMQKRGFACIHSCGKSDALETIEIKPGEKDILSKAVKVAEFFLNAGGTAFEPALSQAQELISKQSFKKADVPGKGGTANQIQSINTITDDIMVAGIFFLAMGILGIILPYYLWHGNKNAAVVAILVLVANIAAYFYELSKLLETFPKEMANGLIIMIIPQIVILILPIILINSEWENLK
jgi:hypothetical protein